MNDLLRPTPETVVIQVFPNGNEIRADLLHAFTSRLPELYPDRDYDVEEICGRDYWRSLPKIHRIRGGRTIAYLVKAGQLPLEFATCPHAVPKRYRLK